jgi:hypothetical protein
MKHARMNKANRAKDVADLVAAFAPQVRNQALAARAFEHKMTPDLAAQVDVKAQMIG